MCLKTSNKIKNPSTKFLKRHILRSDDHAFVGRIYDLSIISMSFDTYEDLAKHADCKYAFDTNEVLKALTSRVESLNLVGDLLWPEPMPSNSEMPVSRYDWLQIAVDVFLMRYISVVDCAILLSNQIYEAGLPARKCTMDTLKKSAVAPKIISLLEKMITDQGLIRAERNQRMHHGIERRLTVDDMSFRFAATYNKNGRGVKGKGSDGRPINLERSFKEGLVELQREFNMLTRKLVVSLDEFYDRLYEEFHGRFTPRFRARTHHFGVGERIEEDRPSAP